MQQKPEIIYVILRTQENRTALAARKWRGFLKKNKNVQPSWCWELSPGESALAINERERTIHFRLGIPACSCFPDENCIHLRTCPFRNVLFCFVSFFFLLLNFCFIVSVVISLQNNSYFCGFFFKWHLEQRLLFRMILMKKKKIRTICFSLWGKNIRGTVHMFIKTEK